MRFCWPLSTAQVLPCSFQFIYHFISIYNSQLSIYNFIAKHIELVFYETIYKVICRRWLLVGYHLPKLEYWYKVYKNIIIYIFHNFLFTNHNFQNSFLIILNNLESCLPALTSCGFNLPNCRNTVKPIYRKETPHHHHHHHHQYLWAL